MKSGVWARMTSGDFIMNTIALARPPDLFLRSIPRKMCLGSWIGYRRNLTNSRSRIHANKSLMRRYDQSILSTHRQLQRSHFFHFLAAVRQIAARFALAGNQVRLNLRLT